MRRLPSPTQARPGEAAGDPGIQGRREGDRASSRRWRSCAAGQVLARIDPVDLRLSLQAAASAVTAAEADDVNARAYLARYESLGRVSPAFIASEYDKRSADARMAAARLEQARAPARP